jgi:putative phosphoserine phosphatase / 1-acylglycerol-3-phosphate O-acyltransferase
MEILQSGSDSTKAAGAGAAIFDLDRTLLAGASGPIISDALRQVGLLSTSTSGIESIAFGIFNLIGETWPSMLISRQGARAARGWPVELVQEAAEIATSRLLQSVLPFALQEIDEHRSVGRKLVMATTTPADLITPLAAALGFDDVVATRYGTNSGCYDGSIDGEFVWGKGKARSIKLWAQNNHVDLEQSYAYSDSYYDVPLLSIVGNPRAVNPDPRMYAQATLRRWPVMHFDVPPGVPKFAGIEPQRLLLLLAQPQLFPWVRFGIEGVENLPSEGPAILVGNHRSYFDPLAIAFLLARAGRPARFLGKKEVFDAPLVGDVVTALGGIRVDRGTGSDAPLRAAEDALSAGEMVALMPQGTIPRGSAFFNPELQGRWGAVRLAQATGAPIIPIGLWGTEQVWPRSSRFPDVTQVLRPPRVQIVVGTAVELEGGSVDQDTKLVMSAISELLPEESRSQRPPSHDDLARTYPGGVLPDDVEWASDHETVRRPGTD